MSKGRVMLLVSLAAVLLVAGMIFYFSAQDGSESSDLSGRVTTWLLSVFRPGFASLSASARSELTRAWNYMVRKGAHFTEYMVLGVALMSFFTALKRFLSLRGTGALAWIFGAVYALTDELHQKQVSGRVFAVKDVMIDSAGVLMGVCLCYLLVRLIRRTVRRRAERGNLA